MATEAVMSHQSTFGIQRGWEREHGTLGFPSWIEGAIVNATRRRNYCQDRINQASTVRRQ